MFKRIRSELEHLQNDEPGTRFMGGFERTHVRNYAVRMTLIVLGLALMLAAAVTFWLPGPNFVLVLAGLALVGGQSKLVARGMDRGEVALRTWHEEVWEPYERKQALLTVLGIVAAIIVALVAWYAYERGWIPFIG